MRHLTFAAVAVAAVSALAAPAFAIPVEWTISGTFDDGATVTGSYVYDYDTNTYSDVSLTTAGGSTLPGAAYVSQAVVGGSNSFVAVTSGGANPGEPILSISVAGSMTNTGGTLNLSGDSEAICNGPGCAFASSSPRALVSGTVTGVPVPLVAVPTLGEWAMMGMAGLLGLFGGLVILRRRRIV